MARLGERFGHTEAAKGKKAIVEHTSSNPNAPLHIGNLRNVMIGAHLARLLAAVGYEVTQAFYVNDLGAQIGLTALAYEKCYPLLKPSMKIDHWIGCMYAIMNTCQELQRAGIDPGKLETACGEGDAAVHVLQDAAVIAAGEDEKKRGSVVEYIDIYRDLRSRYLPMMEVMIPVVRQIPDIKTEAGQLNLRYERQEQGAIKIFRKMVTDCLSGVQETLNTYAVRHDTWDFESELGWEGSNDKVMSIMKNSDYFVPPTQCNAAGVPQGGYLDMSAFIAEQGFKTGKGGYQKDYPPLYVLRPDGSTLYTYRDVVYSFKKAAAADLVLNIICSEQDLAQQKVALAMAMLNPEMVGRQYHASYDLVRLPSGRMSGRRGRYLLADDLYEELKDVIKSTMREKYASKGEAVSPEFFESVTHEVSTAAMKYALLSVSCQMQINFDIKKITSFEDASAPFILYNSTRLVSLTRKFAAGVEAGSYAPLPALDELGAESFANLTDQREWELLMEFVLPFASMIKSAALPTLPTPPGLPDYGTHKVSDFLNAFTRTLSGYYGPAGVRILLQIKDAEGNAMAAQSPAAVAAMNARLHLCATFRQVIDNGLRLLMITPLLQM